MIFLAEAWAIYHGFMLCWNKGYRRVELESNSLVAVRKIHNVHSSDGPHMGIILAIQELLDRDWNCSVGYIHCRPNICAD